MASILIIDDNPDVLRALGRALEAKGHEVHQDEDGHAALRHYAGRPTDLIITDIYMPKMDGIQFIMRVKEAFPEARVIAMSGGGALAGQQVLAAAAGLGVDAVLEKPVDLDVLWDIVDKVLAEDD